MTRILFTVNATPVAVDTDPVRPLLDVLREDLGLTGTKQGCDHEGECGACTILLDGRPVRSCLTPVGKAAGRRVETVEGLAHPDASALGGLEGLHPLQAAFIERGAVQCGYCTPGMLMAAKALLDQVPDPTGAQIVEALEGNLCRCTGYVKIVEAVRLAAARLRDLPPHPPSSSSGQALPAGDLPPNPLPAREGVPGFPLPSQGRGQGERSSPIIGGSMLRTDSVAKVTGAARYAEDISLPGMLQGRGAALTAPSRAGWCR